MESKTKIAAAIIEVMKAVKGMEKNAKVGFGQNTYNGTKDSDVKEVFNDVMAKNGLCVLPIDIEESTNVERWEEQGKQKQSVFTKVKTKYLLLHTSGESITIVGYGHGIDTQDKSAGKATTYALKNTLLYSFLTPVGKIEDTETTHSDTIPLPPAKSTELTEQQAAVILDGCKTLETLKATFLSFTPAMQVKQEAHKNKLKVKLTPKTT